MTETAKLTPAEHLVNLALIVAILLDSEACADRAMQMSANPEAMESLARTPTGTLARRVKEATDVRLGAEQIVAESLAVGNHMEAATALARRVSTEVEAALVLVGGEKPFTTLAPTLDILRLAMSAHDAASKEASRA